MESGPWKWSDRTCTNYWIGDPVSSGPV